MLTPAQILTKLADKNQETVSNVVDKIAAILEAEFVGDPVELWIHETKADADTIVRAISGIMYDRGWRINVIETIADSHNGDSLKLSIAPIDSTDLLSLKDPLPPNSHGTPETTPENQSL